MRDSCVGVASSDQLASLTSSVGIVGEGIHYPNGFNQRIQCQHKVQALNEKISENSYTCTKPEFLYN